MHLLCMLLEGQVETEMKSCVFHFWFSIVHLGNALVIKPHYEYTYVLSLGCIFKHWLTACVHCPLASKLLQDPQVRQSHKVLIEVPQFKSGELFRHEDSPTRICYNWRKLT